MRTKFLKSADGKRIIRLRAIRSVRLEDGTGNGFWAARIRAKLRGGEEVTLAGYAACETFPDAPKIHARAAADMERLLALLNGGRLRRGEEWPSSAKGE